MATTVDPNEVRLTGENSYIRLGQEEGSDFTTTASHWRVLYSPGGAGHALFLRSELTNDEIVAYSDNIGLARWLQGEIEALINPPFADTKIPVVDAVFERLGDIRSFSTERVTARDVDLSLTWYDLMEPMAIHAPPGTEGLTHGFYTVMIPAKRAQLVLNGRFSSGRPVREDIEGRECTTACLAWSETWVRPR